MKRLVSVARFLSFISLIAAMSFGLMSLANAADYPNKNVTVFIPFGAGGGTDTQARIYLNFIEKELGRPFIVVNKPGAAGEIGTTAIYKAEPDGYELGFISFPEPAAMQTFKEVEYESEKFEYIANFTKSPVVLIAPKGGKFSTLEEFISYAKANPGKVTVSLAGHAHTMTLVMLENQAGIEVAPVFYKSGSAALNGLMGNHVDAAMIATQFGVVAESQGHVTIGVAGDERVAKLPNSPTFLEKGYDVQMMQSRVFVAPPGTPKEVLDILTEVCDKIAQNPELKRKIENLGEVYAYASGEELQQYVAKVNKAVIELVKANKEEFIKK